MISLVDEEAGVIQAVRALGAMTGVVEMTVRPLNGDDILAEVAREGRVLVIADSRDDPRNDQAAVSLSGIRGQIVLPLVSTEVLGTLQVCSARSSDRPRSTGFAPPRDARQSHSAGPDGFAPARRDPPPEPESGTARRGARPVGARAREQTRILQSVLDCMGDGVIVADPNAQFLVFNPAAQRLLGHGRIEGPARDWSRLYEIFLPDRATPYPVDDLPLMRAIRGEVTEQAELYIAYPSRDDGTWILVSGRPLRDESGVLRGGVIVFHDITRRKKGERRLAAQYETTRVLAEADTPTQANIKILETICERLDWDFGAFWRVDSHIQRLRCAALWHRPTTSVPRFEAASRTLNYERGIGLPGRVWADGQPAWIADIAGDSNSPRRLAAHDDGLHSAFAVPIDLRGECLGVLERLQRDEAAAPGPRSPGNDEQPGHPDRSVHRAPPDARTCHSVRKAGLTRHAIPRAWPTRSITRWPTSRTIWP